MRRSAAAQKYFPGGTNWDKVVPIPYFTPTGLRHQMRIAQHKLKWIARLLLALALFTQGVLAAHACVSAQASAAHAVLQARDVMEEMPCCPHHADKQGANECLVHCTQSDQVSLDQHGLVALPVTAVVLQVAPPLPERRAARRDVAPLALNCGPPLSILYCSFLL